MWLEPLPDTLIDERPASDPAARYEIRESVEIAFLVVLQNLPGRQRAVFILRDVLGWKANEVADLLDTSVPAVNSALQRARATMKEIRPDPTADPTTGAELNDLLARYVAAWEAANSAKLVDLLHQDAILTMPPLAEWYLGRSAIQWFLDLRLFGEGASGRFRLVSTRANGSPAFAVYERDDKGDFRCAALQVLTISAGQILQVHDFLAPSDRLLSIFDLPPIL